MRNLEQYPVTDDEIQRLIKTMQQEMRDKPIEERAFADNRLAVLDKLAYRYDELLDTEFRYREVSY